MAEATPTLKSVTGKSFSTLTDLIVVEEFTALEVGVNRRLVSLLNEYRVAIGSPETPKPVPGVGNDLPDLSQRGVAISLSASLTLEGIFEAFRHPGCRLKCVPASNIVLVHPAFDAELELFAEQYHRRPILEVSEEKLTIFLDAVYRLPVNHIFTRIHQHRSEPEVFELFYPHGFAGDKGVVVLPNFLRFYLFSEGPHGARLPSFSSESPVKRVEPNTPLGFVRPTSKVKFLRLGEST